MPPSISSATIAKWKPIVDVIAETLALDVAFVATYDGAELAIRASSRVAPHRCATGERLPVEAVEPGRASSHRMAAHHLVELAWPDGARFGVLATMGPAGANVEATGGRLVATFGRVIEEQLADAAALAERRARAEAEAAFARDVRGLVERLVVGAALVRGEELLLNAAAERITGHKRTAVRTLGDWFAAAFPHRARDERAQYEADRSAGFPMVSVQSVSRADGRTRLVEIAATHLGDDAELWLLRDVTGEEASAVALLESDERFRAVTDAAPVIIFTADLERGCRFINREGLDFYGLTLEQARGTATFERVHPDDWSRFAAALARAQASREAVEVELRARRADGVYRWMFGRATPRSGSRGVVEGVVGVLTDITERKQAEETLRHLQERMQLAVDAARIGIWSYEVETEASVWDEQMRSIYGWGDAPLTVEQMNAAFHPDDRERVLGQWEAAMVSGRFESEFRIVRRAAQGDEVVHLRSFARVVHHPDGRPARVIGTSWDVTQASLMQEELRRAKIQADAANRAKGEFLANMSHEIRTPMNGVLGMAQLVLGTDLSAEQRDYVQTIQSSAESLLVVINDILDFSKMEAGKLELPRQDFQLRSGLEDLLKPLMIRAGEKGLHVVGEVDPSVPDRLHGPWERIRQVVMNLVGNAIKFTHEGEVRIVVDIERESATAATLRFSVRDTGVGLAPDELARVFQPFEQIDATDQPRSGTGLGLAISAKLVEMMGGQIGVESRPHEGSTFYATMKVGLAHALAGHETPVRGTPLRPLSILLAEDHFVNRRVAETMLRKRGHVVALATTGREAVDLYQAQPFDVVLMDVEMPEMDGLQATAAIRAIEGAGSKRTPIVALTAYAMAGDGERFLAAGMDGYVTKPMDSKRLWDVIASVLAARE